MVALEAWALGRPVVANAKCDVLKGQCMRSNAGLYYDDEAEFVGALRAIESQRWVSQSLGRSGRQFFRDHYDWPIIERKYLDMFQRLSGEVPTRAMEPLPGWLHRRRQNCPPANEVLASLPSGPSVGGESPRAIRHDSPPAVSPERAVPSVPSGRPRVPSGTDPRRRQHGRGRPSRSRRT
jgi:hypothetical protein